MAAERVLEAGLIGAGWIAERHLAVLDEAADVRLAAVCDVDLGRAQTVAGARGAHAYERWQEMLERERLDVLWVCTPPRHHRDPAVAALKRGIHVYLEKPLARDVADGLAIVEADAESDAICAAAYQWHALDLLDQLRATIAGQAIGLMVGRNFGPTVGRPWFLARSQGGGQIFERASHHIDLQRAIAGEVVEVRAAAGAVALAGTDPYRGSGPDSIEHVGSLLLHFDSGALGAIHTAWTRAGQPQSYGLDLIATESMLHLNLGPDEFWLHGQAAAAAVEIASADPFAASVRRFVDAVRHGDRGLVACTTADALGTLRVAVACERALATSGVVAVGD
ncbi:MAG TPA: Gfo/Idh/MocA family oxidoreductase [Solirubrobacteraceae bacterium]|nr:Gfo/Idh/MocA family oxidoreductase [Solirubrobacteraceae bacterium]